jgi:hypothetical protein
MKKTILLIAAVILAVFAVVGAGCIGADPIVGEWKAGNMPVTFNEDGTGSFTVTLPILGTFNYDLTWAPVEGYKNTYTISNLTNWKLFYLCGVVLRDNSLQATWAC